MTDTRTLALAHARRLKTAQLVWELHQLSGTGAEAIPPRQPDRAAPAVAVEAGAATSREAV